MHSYFNVIEQTLASKLAHQDIGFSIDDVLAKFENFKQTVNTLFTAPHPTAPASGEAPKEE